MNHHGKIWQWQDILKETQVRADEKRLWGTFSLNQQSDRFLILTLGPIFNANTKAPKSEDWVAHKQSSECQWLPITELRPQRSQMNHWGRGDRKIQVLSSVNLSNLSLSLRVKQSFFVVRFSSLFFFFFEAEIWKKILEPSSSIYMLTKGELHHTCFLLMSSPGQGLCSAFAVHAKTSWHAQGCSKSLII